MLKTLDYVMPFGHVVRFPMQCIQYLVGIGKLVKFWLIFVDGERVSCKM